MNEIVFSEGIINDKTLSDGLVQLRQNLISADLEMDSFTFHAFSPSVLSPYMYLCDVNETPLQTVDEEFIVIENSLLDPANGLPYGSSALYTHNGELIGKFYVSSVERVSKNLYYFTCFSAIGLLENRMHYGGMYIDPNNPVTAGAILEDIMGDVEYSVDSNGIEDVVIMGWLPYDTARQNLMHLLFSLGAIVTRGDHGQLSIRYPEAGQPTQIDLRNTEVGGSVTTIRAATEVRVTEHTYLEDGEERLVYLFDNRNSSIAAVRELVLFDKPCYEVFSPSDLLTIHELHPNYAIVSGIGALRGRPYTHMTRILSMETGVDAAENLVSVENETLVSLMNSEYVLKRLAGYYSVTQEAQFGLYINGEDTSNQYSFVDPFGDPRTGFIKSLDITMSNILKAKATLAVDFIPGPFGASVNNYEFITSSGTWEVPIGSTSITMIISSGGNGGEGGADGSDGEDGDAYWSGQPNDGHSGEPGMGGNGGDGGSPGRIYAVTASVTAGDILNITIGAGGLGGLHGERPGLGETGGDTTVVLNGNTYSSALGIIYPNGYTNPISGEVFNFEGNSGVNGGDGGAGWAGRDSWSNQEADSVIYLGITYQGGANGEALDADGIFQGHEWYNYSEAGGGGGAAAGSDGNPGGTGTVSRLVVEGGDGADGASAVAIPEQAFYGNGGRGGNGGGGGGGGGGVSLDWEHMWSTSGVHAGTGGSGGLGSNGGKGGDGWVIIYYRSV